MSVERALERRGLLFLQDARRPSVTTLVAGEAIKGSWWGHASGHEIFAACEALEACGDCVAVKLLDRKVTFVHRALWPALLGAVAERAAWQVDGLSPGAERLLERIEALGSARLDELDGGDSGAAAKELELRLLVLATSEHTASGRHQKRLTAWATWRERVAAPASSPNADGCRTIAAAIEGWEPRPRLPWP